MVEFLWVQKKRWQRMRSALTQVVLVRASEEERSSAVVARNFKVGLVIMPSLSYASCWLSCCARFNACISTARRGAQLDFKAVNGGAPHWVPFSGPPVLAVAEFYSSFSE